MKATVLVFSMSALARSGAVVLRPPTLAAALRTKWPEEPGPWDTSAEEVARVTYHPPAALLPYVAASGPQSLYRVRGGAGAEPALPACVAAVRDPRQRQALLPALQRVRLPRHHLPRVKLCGLHCSVITNPIAAFVLCSCSLAR